MHQTTISNGGLEATQIDYYILPVSKRIAQIVRRSKKDQAAVDDQSCLEKPTERPRRATRQTEKNSANEQKIDFNASQSGLKPDSGEILL